MIVQIQFNKRLAMFQLVCIAIYGVMAAAQSPARAPQSHVNPQKDSPHAFPAPANLKVLPKDLTGEQVHDTMKAWSRDLGVRCVACHTEQREGRSTGKPPSLAFADDSKPMKDIARLMYTMTEQINGKFIAEVDGSGMPVTCGTCHRGNVSPDGFVPTLEQANSSASSTGTASDNR
jgi:mono/diheme cytochrome c family protein